MGNNRAIKIIVVIFVLIFVVHQIYSSLFKPIVTQSAEYFEYTDGTEIAAYIIRNEKIVTTDSDSVLHFMVEDGSRVAKDGTIAQIYNNKNASVTVTQIDSLKEQIADIEELQAYNDKKAADLCRRLSITFLQTEYPECRDHSGRKRCSRHRYLLRFQTCRR